ncbi:MAG: tetratricopeptide repeat protein [Pseudomonadota bacterium]
MRKANDTVHQPSMKLQHRLDLEISADKIDAAPVLTDKAEITLTPGTEAQLNHGIALRSQGRVQESIEHLRDMHHKNPSNIRALHQLAISQRMAGDTDASDASLNILLAIQPKHPGALFEKILNAEQKAHHQQTRALAASTPPAYSTDLASSIRYAITLRNAGLLKDSTKLLESLFVKHHSHTDICLELSRNRVMQGKYSAGMSLVEKVLRATPDNRTAILLRIEYAGLSGRLLHAIQFAQDATQLADEGFTTAIKLARLYRTVGWSQLAIGTLDHLPENINSSIQALLIRADTYCDMNLFEQANSLYQRVLAEHPQTPDAILRSIDLALEGYGEKSPKSILDDLLNQLAASTKATPSLQLLLAATARAGDWKALLERCQSSQERQSFYIYFTALGQFGLGDLRSAKRNICRFLEFNPYDFPGKMLLADIELALGNRHASLSIRKEVASTASLHQQNALLLQALDLARVGKPSEADKLLMSLKNLDGYFPTSDYLGELLKQGSTTEAADCLNKINALRERLPTSIKPQSQPAAEYLAQPPTQCFLEPSHLHKLFDFENGDGLFGSNINPAAFLAWRLTGEKYGDYDTWSRRAVQATRIAPILYRTPARDEDLEKFIVTPDLRQLETLLADGRSFILASTHMGPIVGKYIIPRIPNITYFQNRMTSDSTEIVGATALPTIGKSQEAAIRAITTLRRGGVLSSTPDADIRILTRGKAAPMAKATACLFGVQLEISNMIPKLSRELKVPSYWFQPQWRNGKIHFCIEPLPLADMDEDPVAWGNRWAQAYMDKLEKLMTSEPENQNLDAPFWRYLLYYAHESAVLAPLLK